MSRVPRTVQATKMKAADTQLLAVYHWRHLMLIHRSDLAPESLHHTFTPDAGCALDESFGLTKMAGTIRMNEDRRTASLCDDSGSTRVVEVDVSQQDGIELVPSPTEAGESELEALQAGSRARIDDHETVAGRHEIGRDDTGDALELEVDELDLRPWSHLFISSASSLSCRIGSHDAGNRRATRITRCFD